MPRMVWPPPLPSARLVLPHDLTTVSKTLGQVAQKIESACAASGYAEKSYWAIPGGIAIVTRLEHIYADGRPYPADTRWLQRDGYLEGFSLSSYIRALFTARSGYYRVIIFAVTDTPFGAATKPITPDYANTLLGQGFNALPDSVAQTKLSEDTTVTALIFEFERPQNNDAVQLNPSPIDARAHLMASGLWSALTR